MQKDVVILSVPYTEAVPMVAPVLLSSCLENAGITAQGVDLSIRFTERFIDEPYWSDLRNILAFGTTSNTELPRRIVVDVLKFIKQQLQSIKEEFNPEWLGLSIFTNESVNFSYLLIPYIKKYLPDVKIIIGGRALELINGVHNVPNYKLYYQYGMADSIVIGDSESSIIDVIKYGKTGVIFSAQQTKEDLDQIPTPNWKDYDLKIYDKFKYDKNRLDEDQRYMAVTASKGCVRKCTFCDVASWWPDYIFRDGKNVANEIISAYKNTGVVNFEFTDNLINGSITNYRKMNQHLAEEIPNTISYRGFAIFRGKNQMPDSDFDLMAKAGCKAWDVGVESGSEAVRNELRKKFDNDDMDHSVRSLHRVGVEQRHLMMVGYPTETVEDFEQSLEMLHRYAPLNKDGMIRIYMTTTFMLLNNSPLASPEYKEKYGLNFDPNDHMGRFFWTAECNPENTFPERFRRWRVYTDLMQELGYQFAPGTPHDKNQEVLKGVIKIYNERFSANIR